MHVPLRRVAHVRSGDKGDTATLAVIAYSDQLYPILKAQLTAERVKAFYGAAVTRAVVRYEVDAIGALNFTLDGALGGGVSRSLSLDNYGKALSAALLRLIVETPDGLANHLRGADDKPEGQQP
jgi:hypothetical protein